MRLALAYAPARAREDWLTLLALDARLGGVVRGAREPVLAQLRLAWWRDRLAGEIADWPRGEPLLARLAAWGDLARALAPLVDGWEALLGEPPLGANALNVFADGRGAGFTALAERLGGDTAQAAAAGRVWALADVALRADDPRERDAAVALLRASSPITTGRQLRPGAVLAGLSVRAIRRGSEHALDGPGSLLAAVRLGLRGQVGPLPD